MIFIKTKALIIKRKIFSKPKKVDKAVHGG